MHRKKEKRKVLLVSSNTPRFPGGSGDQTVLFQTMMLLKAEHDARMLCLIEGGIDNHSIAYNIPEELRSCVEIHEYEATWKMDHGCSRIRNLKDNILRYSAQSNRIYSSTSRIISKTIMEYQPDGIIFDQIGYSMVKWKRELDLDIEAKWLLRIYDTFAIYLSKYIANSKSLKDRTISRMQRQCVERYEKRYGADWDAILVLSEEEHTYYTSLLGNRVPVMTTQVGIDVDYFDPNCTIQNKDIDIVYTGTMNWKPNVDNVVWMAKEILPRVKERVPQVKFAVIGRNPSKRVKMLESDNTTVSGEVEDIRAYMRRSKVSFIFSFSGSGKKIKLMELLSMGVPVICEPESLGGYGTMDIPGVIVIKRNETDKIVETIVRLISDTEVLSVLSRSASKAARASYDYRKIELEYAEVW